MKKGIVTIIAVAAIGLATFQVVDARPGKGAGVGSGYAQQALDPATQKAQDKFLKETTELRKQMVAKRAEMHALMSGTNPDGQKAAKLSEEMFELREQLRTKAQAAGLPAGFGPGLCAGNGMGSGMGMGGGMMGYGPHRGW